VRLIHQPKYYFLLGWILCSKLLPKIGELVIGRAILPHNLAVPATIVMDIDYTMSTSLETGSHELIVIGEVAVVQWISGIIDEVLPSHSKTKAVQLVILRKVLHLARVIAAASTQGRANTTDYACARRFVNRGPE